MYKLISKLLLVSIFFISCGQQQMTDNYGTFIFYKLSTTGSFTVWINGDRYADVPYVDHTPACNTSDGLRLKFAPGTYSVDIHNNNNTTYIPPVQVTLSKGECKLLRAQ